MNRFKSALIGLSLLTTSAIAQTDNALLYEVTGNGLTAPSYLYGTFHLVCPNDLVITDAMKKAMADTRQVYLEVDMDDPSLMANMQKAMVLPQGKTAKDYLSADDYKLLNDYMTKTMSVKLDLVNTFRPIGLTSFLVMGMLHCQPASYDMTFAQMAAKDKKEVLGLETMESQLAVLDKKPLEKQFKELADLARDPEKAQKEFADLLAAYKAKNLNQMKEVMKKSSTAGEFAEMEGPLLNERNANWIPVIEKAAKTTPTFFAFGAGHLIGDKGVIALLKKQGYSVKAVN
ncbi:TraB/GumN family protein [Fibrella sp. HMF5335]|uniref:TraB/GumN family protein n=1 Tax=Fibrella rubiginis TaxID=2817060 RepID=A0A939K7V7_9BACT|nr:TraB/GumN family protein [Fibrella rubiginis]MBO0939055.1 TraB/GumN family protein [Fibrella rubiginis]